MGSLKEGLLNIKVAKSVILTPIAKLVYHYILNTCEGKGYCDDSTKKIAEFLDVSAQSVINSTNELHEMKNIIKVSEKFEKTKYFPSVYLVGLTENSHATYSGKGGQIDED